MLSEVLHMGSTRRMRGKEDTTSTNRPTNHQDTLGQLGVAGTLSHFPLLPHT